MCGMKHKIKRFENCVSNMYVFGGKKLKKKTSYTSIFEAVKHKSCSLLMNTEAVLYIF